MSPTFFVLPYECMVDGWDHGIRLGTPLFLQDFPCPQPPPEVGTGLGPLWRLGQSIMTRAERILKAVGQQRAASCLMTVQQGSHSIEPTRTFVVEAALLSLRAAAILVAAPDPRKATAIRLRTVCFETIGAVRCFLPCPACEARASSKAVRPQALTSVFSE